MLSKTCLNIQSYNNRPQSQTSETVPCVRFRRFKRMLNISMAFDSKAQERDLISQLGSVQFGLKSDETNAASCLPPTWRMKYYFAEGLTVTEVLVSLSV